MTELQVLKVLTHILMICGCLKSLRLCISRFILPASSKLWILSLLRNLMATCWPVCWCSAPVVKKFSELLKIQECFRSTRWFIVKRLWFSKLTFYFSECSGSESLPDNVVADLYTVNVQRCCYFGGFSHYRRLPCTSLSSSGKLYYIRSIVHPVFMFHYVCVKSCDCAQVVSL